MTIYFKKPTTTFSRILRGVVVVLVIILVASGITGFANSLYLGGSIDLILAAALTALQVDWKRTRKKDDGTEWKGSDDWYRKG